MCDMCVWCVCVCVELLERIERSPTQGPKEVTGSAGASRQLRWELVGLTTLEVWNSGTPGRANVCPKKLENWKKKNLEHRFRDFQGCPRFHLPQMWSSSRTCYRFTHRCWYQPFVHSLMLWWGWINSSALSRFFCGTNVSRRIQLC